MFNILLTLIIVSNLSFITILIRLNVKHKQAFEQLKIDGMLFLGSVKQLARLIEFIVKSKSTELNDKFLSLVGYIFVVSFSATIPVMIAYALMH